MLTKVEMFCPLHIVYAHVLAQDDFADSPLRVACSENQLEVVKVLIENGAVVNYSNKVCFDSILL